MARRKEPIIGITTVEEAEEFLGAIHGYQYNPRSNPILKVVSDQQPKVTRPIKVIISNPQEQKKDFKTSIKSGFILDFLIREHRLLTNYLNSDDYTNLARSLLSEETAKKMPESNFKGRFFEGISATYLQGQLKSNQFLLTLDTLNQVYDRLLRSYGVIPPRKVDGILFENASQAIFIPETYEYTKERNISQEKSKQLRYFASANPLDDIYFNRNVAWQEYFRRYIASQFSDMSEIADLPITIPANFRSRLIRPTQFDRNLNTSPFDNTQIPISQDRLEEVTSYLYLTLNRQRKLLRLNEKAY
jgi:hypothetical protein